MIKPNWDQFKVKFSENPQKNFEWFCYLLFCQEFNKPLGVFRYKNQSGIETNPVDVNNEVIGWQAKFYGTTLADYKSELIDGINKSKRDYPNLTKILLYTNQEWGQGRKSTDSKAKIDVEQAAAKLKLAIEWRTAIFFDSPFVTINNKVIAKHFFSPEKSIFDLLSKRELHSDAVLQEIKASIHFKSIRIEIDRKSILQEINEKLNKNSVIILSGAAGTGKTAVIKTLYLEQKDKNPIYIFKATEFHIRNIAELFDGYNLQDFLDAHEKESCKIVVIDSAEKLLDINDSDSFKEFLSGLIKNKWRIIFTTRNNYLQDLNCQFIEIHDIIPINLQINNLISEELSKLAQEFQFALPEDSKLLELIKNPFYLNEYLKYYYPIEKIGYVAFKLQLWNKVIKKAKPQREQAFIEIAFNRASSSMFFVTPSHESSAAVDELLHDGILGYESPGYFITHDIYEEWAIEIKIDSEFIRKENTKAFFEEIGYSLPVRRGFRNWVSEKLLLEDESIKRFVEEVVDDRSIEPFWKDEILISVLLSDYSDYFFILFEKKLLADNQSLLKRLSFLIRIACKEVDNDFFTLIGIRNAKSLSFEYVLTKPKGKGWQSIIAFIFNRLNDIGIRNVYFILPVIYDWNCKFKDSETSRFASLIALKYYEQIIQEDGYLHDDKNKSMLLKTILLGALEIKSELKSIFDEVLKNKWKNHSDLYFDLSEMILTKFDGSIAAKCLPQAALELAELFWTNIPEEGESDHYSSHEVENSFGVTENHFDYFPASAYQTPIFGLLQYSLKDTVDFILRFTNRSVECYSKSVLDSSQIEEINVFYSEDSYVTQYVSNRIWNIYRGTQGSPYVLESIHMALEKYFIEIGKNSDSKILESWLIYLLKGSKSASITAIVTSIVLAYPEKLFNVAKLLFKTKLLFIYETSRCALDKSQKSSLQMLKTNFGFNRDNEIFENERIDACDYKHRNLTLEHLFFNYQCFRKEETSEEEAKGRQKVLWGILDNYYKELEDKKSDTDSEKTWKLCLARMDRRKMDMKAEATDEGVLIHLNPQLAPELKAYSQKSESEITERFKYTNLKLWSNYKIRGDEKYKQYTKYETSCQIALAEVKEILDTLQKDADETFHLFNSSIPGDVCSVLIRDYADKLSEADKIYCKDVVLDYAAQAVHPGYRYQTTDATQSAFAVLPIILQKFPEEKEKVKIILLIALLNEYPIDMAGSSFNVFSIMAIQNLWLANPEDAKSILIGYLFLEPRYRKIIQSTRKANFASGNFNIDEKEVRKVFAKENEEILAQIMDNNISIDILDDLENVSLDTLETAFRLIPNRNIDHDCDKIDKRIISVFAKKLLHEDRDHRTNYRTRHDFLDKLAYLVLSSEKDKIKELLSPFVVEFNASEAMADLFKSFIHVEDNLHSYVNFWEVWNLFKDKIVGLCQDSRGYSEEIIQCYFFAQTHWKEKAVEWSALNDENKRFFKEILEEIGYCSSVAYSISKLLTNIGSRYLNDGVSWLSNMLSNYKENKRDRLEDNTIYYLEKVVRKFIFNNSEKIKRRKETKAEILVLLNYLVEKGSVSGFMLRESIL